MKYTDFVKAHFHKLPANMSAKEKMKKIAELWRAQKGQGQTHARSAQGAGLFGSIGDAADGIGSLFGLGMEKKKKGRGRPRKAKGGSIENPEGAGIFDDIVDGVGKVAQTATSLIPAGMMAYKAYSGRGLQHKKRGRPSKKQHTKSAQGAGLFGSIGDAADGIGSLFGLGLEKHKKGRGRPRKSAKGGAILHNGEIIPNEQYGKRFGGCHCQHNNELMKSVAHLRKAHAQGGSLGDILKSVAPILPLLAL